MQNKLGFLALIDLRMRLRCLVGKGWGLKFNKTYQKHQ